MMAEIVVVESFGGRDWIGGNGGGGESRNREADASDQSEEGFHLFVEEALRLPPMGLADNAKGHNMFSPEEGRVM